MSVGLVCAVLFIVLLLLFVAGYPIAFAMATITVIGILWLFEPTLLFQLAQISVELGTNFLLLVIPLFVLMAEFIVVSGHAEKAVNAASKWLNWLPGSLAISTVFGCSFFAAVCGSSPVTAATMGRVAIPEMANRGYDPRLGYGVVVSAGTIGIMIPPSLTMILYGSMTGNSIGKLFMAGIVPGVVLGLLMSLLVVAIVLLKPSSAPRHSEDVTWGDRLRLLVKVGPTFGLAFLVLASIYMGFATPTEAAAAGAIGAFILFLCSGRFELKTLSGCLVRSATITCAIMILLVGGTCMAFLMATTGIPQDLATIIVGLGLGPWGTMILINAILIVLGCFLDPMGVLVLTVPLFVPIVTSLGLDPIWFGVIMTLNVQIGMLTPPVGLNLYVLKAVFPEVPINHIVIGSLPFFVLMVLCLVLFQIFPELTLWLPSRMI
ncbi:MAG: TRAP transporter large permease subunit [Desulfomonilaceae bacterium]|nr:TRAP transporter large permease subunit [Desulfomonilaceae bacterium]